MSNELLSVLEYMEKEKGIGREDMISAITASILNSTAKSIHADQNLKVEINPKTGALKAWSLLEVVDSMSDPATQIHIEKAKLIDPDLKIGETLEREIDPSYLGRIAAQSARQAIMQRIRQFEKDRVYDDFKDQVGDIVTGIVRRHDRGDLMVDIGKAEAMLPMKERIAGEDYAPGEQIRCLLLKIEQTPRGPELILSRTSTKFVTRLFELEVSEILDKTVTIEAIAREPGYRTKVCVNSTDPKVDPVGACVGARGARVKNIVRELSGEKVDILRYFEDPKKMLEEAIRPAVPHNIIIDPQQQRIHFEVVEDDLSITIGRKGQNAKLTSRLMGWKLDISKEEKQGIGFDEKLEKAASGLSHIPGIPAEIAHRLVGIGITSPEAFEGVTPEDLVDAGFTNEEATDIIAKISQFVNKS